MPRQCLPARRGQITVGVTWRNDPYDVSFALFDNGQPAEMFISSIKSGSDVQIVAHDAAVLVSLALQFGAGLETLRKALARNENGTPQSIVGRALDAIAGELVE